MRLLLVVGVLPHLLAFEREASCGDRRPHPLTETIDREGLSNTLTWLSSRGGPTTLVNFRHHLISGVSNATANIQPAFAKIRSATEKPPASALRTSSERP